MIDTMTGVQEELLGTSDDLMNAVSWLASAAAGTRDRRKRTAYLRLLLKVQRLSDRAEQLASECDIPDDGDDDPTKREPVPVGPKLEDMPGVQGDVPSPSTSGDSF